MSQAPNVIDIAARLRLHETVRPFLTILSAAPAVADVLELALPNCTKEQQRALLAIIAWRVMGAQLPASIELLKRLPVMAGLHEESIQAALMQLCEADVLVFQSYSDGREGAFVWPALEHIITVALAEQDAPKILVPR